MKHDNCGRGDVISISGTKNTVTVNKPGQCMLYQGLKSGWLYGSRPSRFLPAALERMRFNKLLVPKYPTALTNVGKVHAHS